MDFFIRRLAQAIVVLSFVCVINFFLFHLSPGDPTNLYFGPKNSRAVLAEKQQQMGLDLPWYVQLQNWSKKLLQGDLGYSWSKHRPVSHLLEEAIPATLQLTLTALFLNLLLGCCVGIISGLYANRWFGKLLDMLSLGLYSIPAFWLALVSIFLFSVMLKWFPASGMNALFLRDNSLWSLFRDRIHHLILPASILGIIGAAATSRFVKNNIQDVLQRDFIRTARAKGLPGWKIYFHHAFFNALLPVITLIGLSFPFLIGGTVVIEIIFAWPGMGRLAYEAIQAKDYPVIMAINLIAAVFVLIGNFFSDVLHRQIDPRVRLAKSE